MADALWYWHRLRAMDAAELWHRVMEKAKHVTEPFARGAIKNARITQEPANHPMLPSREVASALLKQTLAHDAAKLLDGKWSLFGWKEVQVSLLPDWHRDYMRGVSVPMSGKLNHRSLPAGADVRTIWEINRWAEMVRLAMHGRLNDDVVAIQRAQEWLADWVEKNSVREGINWTSALEGGLRLINFCWFDALVQSSLRALQRVGDGNEDSLNALKRAQQTLRDAIVPAHVWWVRRYLSFGSSANNHRLGELTGLLLAVKRWPELERITGSANGLWDQIAECVLAQFAEDGGNREQALHYHLFAFEMALHACRVMNVTDGPVIERLRCAAEFFVRMSHPQEPWDYGDNDDAQIVPLTMNREKAVAEWCSWMNAAAAVGGAPRNANALGYWLGDSPIQNPESKIQNRDWWIAKESGMAVIERDGWKVRVDASPLGFGKMAAHGHCDALHVSIWDGEHALVIDPGTGGYFGDKELRAELASWNAHNGPQPVEGFKTPRRIGTFLWGVHHEKPKLHCDGDSIRASINHGGVGISRVVSIADGAVVIEDSISNVSRLGECWTFAPECDLHQEFDAMNLMLIERDETCWRFDFVADDLSARPKAKTVSRCFGETQKSRAIDISASGKITLTLRRGKMSGLQRQIENARANRITNSPRSLATPPLV